MLAEDAQGIGDQHLPLIAQLGFDYVELPLAQMMQLSNAEFQSRILNGLTANDLSCLACNNFIPSSHRLTGPDADLAAAHEYALRALDRAQAMGVQTVVFGSSGARNSPDGFDQKQAMDQLADFLCSLADAAQQRDVTIAIEPLNRMESNLINRLSDAVTLARRVAHPCVKALADFYHMGVGLEPLIHVKEAGLLLRHVHIARVLGRGMPNPDDGEPYAEIFAQLRAISYDGTISIEAYAPKSPRDQLGRALSLFRVL